MNIMLSTFLPVLNVSSITINVPNMLGTANVQYSQNKKIEGCSYFH